MSDLPPNPGRRSFPAIQEARSTVDAQEKVTPIHTAEDADRPDQAYAAKPKEPEAANPVRRVTLIVLAIGVLLFAWHLIAARLTPYTSQAFVQTFVVDIAPEVAGPVVTVEVEDNQGVKVGQALFRIDPVRFELAVRAAEAALDQAGQAIGISTAQVAAAQAELSAAEAALANVREQAARVFDLVKKGIYPKARADQAEAQLRTAQEDVSRAQADLEAARQQLGPEGADNPQIRSATAQLERAQLDLIRTTILAPTDGKITNLKLSIGQFVSVGTPVMTFIDINSVWMVADLPERSLANVQPGDRAEVAFDVLAGQVFAAKVESIGWGVSIGAGRTQVDSGGLPALSEEKGWVRTPQLFPVLLIPETPLAGRVPAGSVRLGSRGSVVIYSGDNAIMNGLAALYIRIMSWLAYVV
jgi:multidrug resistance efflux pump